MKGKIVGGLSFGAYALFGHFVLRPIPVLGEWLALGAIDYGLVDWHGLNMPAYSWSILLWAIVSGIGIGAFFDLDSEVIQ